MKYFHPRRWYRISKEKLRSVFLYYLLPDKVYLKYRYKQVMGKKLNLKNPQSFNEKMQWLKLYDRNPAYHKMVDKYEAKKFVANIIGEEYIIPTYGVWDSFEEIDFNALPNEFVLKCTHDSGSVVICKDKELFDYKNARIKLSKALNQNYYRYENKQWIYKSIKPRIIAELYLISDIHPKIEYQVFCNNNNPQFFLVRNDLGDRRNMDDSFAISYSLDWQRVVCRIGEEETINIEVEKPHNYLKMIDFAKKLSVNVPHMRVDYYEIDKKIYFSELTLCTNGGFFTNYNEKALEILNNSLDIKTTR